MQFSGWQSVPGKDITDSNWKRIEKGERRKEEEGKDDGQQRRKQYKMSFPSQFFFPLPAMLIADYFHPPE